MNEQDNQKWNLMIKQIDKDITAGMKSLPPINGNSWLEEYEKWLSNNNDFDGYMQIKDPFNINNAGDVYFFPSSKSGDQDKDIMCKCIFIVDELQKYELDTVAIVRKEKVRGKKLKTIDNYFSLIDKIKTSQLLARVIVNLQHWSEDSLCLHGKSKSVDLYTSFFTYRELLRKETVGACYLLFTRWRIARSEDNLNLLINCIDGYTKTYYYDFDNDPDMHLQYSIEDLSLKDKLSTLTHWFERITYHTNGIFKTYEDLDWLCSTDKLIDEIPVSNQISKLEMLQYKRIFSDDTNEDVRKKAICNHSYGVWIKTSDIMTICTEMMRIIYESSNDELNNNSLSKAEMLELYDNMLKIKNFYVGRIFTHLAYYKSERHYLDSQVMEALEEDAEQISASIDDVIKFSDAIAGNNMDDLLQAKINYVNRLSEYISAEQEEKLDELTNTIVNKLKNEIQSLPVYDELYGAVTDEFKQYSSQLVRYPQIFASLVSAEYLYQQYIEKREANPNFDYSCISIMYYMALEDFCNKLIYTPYSQKVLSGLTQEDNRKCVSDKFRYWDKKTQHYKKSCEIGPLGCLFERCSSVKMFREYLDNTFPGIKRARLSEFGGRLKKVAPRRNEAAHGGNVLSYETAKQDKTNVYDIEIGKYRGMILELLDILYNR